MRLSGSRGSNLTRTGAHALVAISFSTTAVQTTLGSRGRIGTGSGVRAGFDPVWSTANRCFDGDARRKSQAIHLVWPLAPPLSKGIDRFLTGYPCHSPTRCPLCVKPGWGHAPCPCACPHLGAEAGGRPQRERGSPSVRECATVCCQNEFPSHPLPRARAPQGVPMRTRGSFCSMSSPLAGADTCQLGSICARVCCVSVAGMDPPINFVRRKCTVSLHR